MLRIIRKKFSHHVKLSHFSGPKDINLLNHTIGEVFHHTITKYGSHEGLISVHQNKRFTWEEVNVKVDQLAKAIISLGLEPQSRIGIVAPNCYEWFISQYAIAQAGMILVNINPSYQEKDLKYCLNKVKVNSLIMPTTMKTTHFLHILRDISPDLYHKIQDPRNLKLSELPSLKQIILLDNTSTGEAENHKHYLTHVKENHLISYEEFTEEYSKKCTDEEYKKRQHFIKPDHPANIQFTSGTTGLPKGAILSHYNIINNGFCVGNTIKYKAKDRILITVPMYHCFGTVLGSLAAITKGSTVIYSSPIFDPKKVLETVEKEKVSSLYGVPTMFLQILKHQEEMKKDIKSLRTGVMAGSICPKYLMDRVINELGLLNLTNCYGMTELSPVTHQTRMIDSVEKKTKTVGINIAHTETKIVDKEGKIVPIGTKGEICSKGFGVMIGYWEDEQATKDCIDKDGYMKTGDIGHFDEEGYLTIDGRSKDTIIRGGENISPREIEEFLITHPCVEDVHCFAVKDEKYGDEICIWVKKKPGMELDKREIQHFCKGQLAHFKVPKYVRLVDSFPMTITGKVQKYIMRDISNKILEEKSEEM